VITLSNTRVTETASRRAHPSDGRGHRQYLRGVTDHGEPTVRWMVSLVRGCAVAVLVLTTAVGVAGCRSQASATPSSSDTAATASGSPSTGSN